MKAFRYQAIELNGAPVEGEIEAADRSPRSSYWERAGFFRPFLKAAPRPGRPRPGPC